MHPLIGGVVLFTRNYADREQLAALVASIKALRDPALVVAVDHEGGRVQRFREGGFAALPPAAKLGANAAGDPGGAAALAAQAGWLLGEDLRAVGVDISFAPVIDCFNPESSVLGDRCFHDDPETVAELAGAFLAGMHYGGVAGCVKHFPGHGGVAGDSHLELPEDDRELADLAVRDLVPFKRLRAAEAVMTAHVLFPRITPELPCFSRYWLAEVLRRELGFRGAVVSDDLSMAGASTLEPRPEDRVARALASGCDIVLLLNDRDAVTRALDGISAPAPVPESLWKHWARPVGAARAGPARPDLSGTSRDEVIARLARHLERVDASTG